MVVAKHRVLECLVKAGGSESHHSLSPPSQFLREAAIGVSCSESAVSAPL